MNDFQQEIYKTIDKLVDYRLNYFEYNYKIEGKIVEVVDTNTYKVKIQNNISTVKSMNNDLYNVGDIVDIIVFNNNYTDKKILCKR